MESDTVTLPFDRDDRAFVLGVQVGMVYALADACPEGRTCLVYAEAAEMMARIAERTNRSIQFSDAGDEWIQVDIDGGGDSDG